MELADARQLRAGAPPRRGTLRADLRWVSIGTDRSGPQRDITDASDVTDSPQWPSIRTRPELHVVVIVKSEDRGSLIDADRRPRDKSLVPYIRVIRIAQGHTVLGLKSLRTPVHKRATARSRAPGAFIDHSPSHPLPEQTKLRVFHQSVK